MRIVIVGNGVAGIEAALAVRARRPSWSVTIVSEESDHFVARTALMYVLAGQLRELELEPLERDAYPRHGFERVRARAVGIDPAEKRLLLSGEPGTLPYDRLLVACGSRPRPAPWPGAELGGVGHFVTLADLDWLRAELGQAVSPRVAVAPALAAGTSPYARRAVAAERRGRPCRRPVVIGGGLIGLEVTEALASLDLAPRLVVREEWLWPMGLDTGDAAFIVEHVRRHGVEVELGADVVRLVGDAAGHVCAVETRGGTSPADVVVVAIGVVPQTEWLAGALALEPASGGIRVDSALRTSASDVLAAGDCAAVPTASGQLALEQLWYTARAQGRVAGARLVGEDVTYSRGIPYNAAKLFDVEWTTVGPLDSPQPSDASFVADERGAVRSRTRLVAREGRFLGGTFLGRRWEHTTLMRWIDEGRPIEWVRRHLDEAAFDMELVPPLGAAHLAWKAG